MINENEDKLKENEDRLKEKINFFIIERIEVHIKLYNKTFLNGFITKRLRPNVYWMKENKLGEVFLFLKDIHEIEEYKTKENW